MPNKKTERIILDFLFLLPYQELLDRWSVGLTTIRKEAYRGSVRREYLWLLTHEGNGLYSHIKYLEGKVTSVKRAAFCRHIHLLEYFIMMEKMAA